MEQRGGVTRISVDDDIDVAGESALREAGREALSDPRCRQLELDLSAVTFIDSTGIGVLVELRNAALEKQIPLTLTPSSRVAEVLRLTALDEVFATREE